MFCREQAVRIATLEEELRSSGDLTSGKLVGIGNGTPDMARDFAEQFNISYPLFTDPQRKTYQALGMKTKFGLGLRTPLHIARAMRNGFLQGRIQGSPFQQGGEALISSQGEILWSRISNEAGSHASDQEIRNAFEMLN